MPIQPSTARIHPDLNPLRCAGGLFDVPPSDMDLNIGRRGKVLDPGRPSDGTIHFNEFEVVAVQKDYAGKICYRVVFDGDAHRFGSVLDPERAVLL